MDILVTGGLGYIGSHIIKNLYVNYGFKNIIIIDNLSTGNIINHKYGTFINTDINDYKSLENIFKKYKINFIFHIAGKAFVKESFEKINEYYNTNVNGTINILNLMVKYNVKNIIFSSSCSVYGNSLELPITEKSKINPISPYANTKKICEEIIIDFSKNKNIKSIILRYFNVAGNDFDCDVIDVSNNFSRIIPTIILKIINDDVIYINGNNYNTIDGTCSRSYIHVIDIAEAHIKCLNYLENSNKDYLIINIGSDKCYTILEIIKFIEKKFNKKAKYIFKDKIEGDPDIVFCDNKLSKEVLDFNIKYDINDIIDSYINFLNVFILKK